MTHDCATIREMIPDVAAGRLAGEAAGVVEVHVVACGDCRAELGLARSLYESRPRVSVDMSGRVLTALRRRRRVDHRHTWGLAAAAVAALALGIGISSGPGVTDSTFTDEMATDLAEEELWLAEDGVLAGAPMIETLSDEALAELLEKLTTPSMGGQA